MTQKIRIKLKGKKTMRTNEKIAESIIQTTLGDGEHMPAREVLKTILEDVAKGNVPPATFADTILHMIEMGSMEARLSDAGVVIEDTRQFVNDSASTILGLTLFGDLMEAIQNRGAKVQVWTEHDIAEAILHMSSGHSISRRDFRYTIDLVRESDEWASLSDHSWYQTEQLRGAARHALHTGVWSESR